MMAVTTARSRQAIAKRGTQAGELAGGWQVESKSRDRRISLPMAHSTGTTNSLARTMFRRLRAAASMVRGSLRSCSTSARRDWFAWRKPLTWVCIRTNCCDAKDILVLVRSVTPTHMANVPRIIIPKITHAGRMPPRRRTSAGLPIMLCEISLTLASGEDARDATRCALIRSSTQ